MLLCELDISCWSNVVFDCVDGDVIIIGGVVIFGFYFVWKICIGWGVFVW